MLKTVLETYRRENILRSAYLIVGEDNSLWPELKSLFAKIVGGSIETNPDVWCEEYVVLDLAATRRLKQNQLTKPFTGRRLIGIKFESISEEAQNALLGLLEEPSATTHLFLVSPTEEGLLPTIRSRCQIVREAGPAKNDPKTSRFFAKFWAAGPEQRLATIDLLLRNNNGQEVSRRFINGLEIQLAALWRVNPNQDLAERQKLLKEIGRCRRLMGQQAVLPRLILEHLVLILPRQSVKIRSDGL